MESEHDWLEALAREYGLTVDELHRRLTEFGFWAVLARADSPQGFEAIKARGLLEANGLRPAV